MPDTQLHHSDVERQFRLEVLISKKQDWLPAKDIYGNPLAGAVELAESGAVHDTLRMARRLWAATYGEPNEARFRVAVIETRMAALSPDDLVA